MRTDLGFNLDVKARLGRLLAGENLRIQINPSLRTAQFNVKTRQIDLPLLKGVSEEVWNTYVAHEVAHALWSPLEGLKEAARKVRFDILNIVEDVRIEKLMKREYPGLIPAFIKGSNEIFEKHGFRYAEVPGMLLHDRVNIHYKLGDVAGVSFYGMEQDLIAKLDALETFEDTVEAAVMLQKLLKSEVASKTASGQMQTGEGQPGEGKPQKGAKGDQNKSSDPSDADGDGEGDADGEGKSSPDKGKPGEKPGKGEGKGKGSEPGAGDDASDDEGEGDGEGEGSSEPQRGAGRNRDFLEKNHKPGDKTEKGSSAFHTKDNGVQLDAPLSKTHEMGEKASTVDTNSEVARVSYAPVNWERFVVPLARVNEICDNAYLNSAYLAKDLEHPRVEAFGKRVKIAANMLAREFDQRKSADAYARAGTAKTGKIAPTRLWASKITDDIFSRVTVMPEGKNHGFCLIIDWSGSMNGDKTTTTMTQAAAVATFAKRLGMPFKVFLFSDNHDAIKMTKLGYGYGSQYDAKSYKGPTVAGTGLFLPGKFALIELANETLPMPKLIQRFTEFAYWDASIHSAFCKSGTPLNESIYASIEMGRDLKETWGVQYMHMMVMTDGCGGGLSQDLTDTPAGRAAGFTFGAGSGFKSVDRYDMPDSTVVCFPDGKQVLFQTNEYTGNTRNVTSLLMNLYRYLVDGSFIFFVVEDRTLAYDNVTREAKTHMNNVAGYKGKALTYFGAEAAAINDFVMVGGFCPDMRLTARKITMAERKNKIKTRATSDDAGKALSDTIAAGLGTAPLYATGADVTFLVVPFKVSARARKNMDRDQKIENNLIETRRDGIFAKTLCEIIS